MRDASQVAALICVVSMLGARYIVRFFHKGGATLTKRNTPSRDPNSLEAQDQGGEDGNISVSAARAKPFPSPASRCSLSQSEATARAHSARPRPQCQAAPTVPGRAHSARPRPQCQAAPTEPARACPQRTFDCFRAAVLRTASSFACSALRWLSS
jgi:hypothetical protein